MCKKKKKKLRIYWGTREEVPEGYQDNGGNEWKE